jgi:hypothetical protein
VASRPTHRLQQYTDSPTSLENSFVCTRSWRTASADGFWVGMRELVHFLYVLPFYRKCCMESLNPYCYLSIRKSRLWRLELVVVTFSKFLLLCCRYLVTCSLGFDGRQNADLLMTVLIFTFIYSSL